VEEEVIENEEQEIDYFNNRSLKGHMSGWGSVGQWGELKRYMLGYIWPFRSMLDIGCGDMVYMSSFEPFVNRKFSYLGIDGSTDVITRARKKCSLHLFHQMTISELIKSDLNKSCDVIVCYDVLFHIVEDWLYRDLLRWLFRSSADHLLLTFLRVNEEDHQASDKGHFIIRDFGKVKIPSRWSIRVEKKNDRKARQRIALLSKNDGKQLNMVN